MLVARIESMRVGLDTRRLYHAPAVSNVLFVVDDVDSVHLVDKDESSNHVSNLVHWPSHHRACA